MVSHNKYAATKMDESYSAIRAKDEYQCNLMILQRVIDIYVYLKQNDVYIVYYQLWPEEAYYFDFIFMPSQIDATQAIYLIPIYETFNFA